MNSSFWQYLLPKHLLSNLMFKFARCKNRWLYKKFTRWIINFYNIDMSEAKFENIDDYKHFNDFFTRALKPNTRPIADSNIVSPVDGTISQFGAIKNNTLIQAKGKFFNLNSLLGKKSNFKNFITIYLAPNNYHRIHMPFDGTLLSVDYIAGNLFSVNTTTAKNINNLFARNERVVCYFNTNFGKCAIVLVGAIFVGSIELVWLGQVTPPYGKSKNFDYSNKNITLKKGDEMGRFNMGSTVILLTEYNFNFNKQQKIIMGEALI